MPGCSLMQEDTRAGGWDESPPPPQQHTLRGRPSRGASVFSAGSLPTCSAPGGPAPGQTYRMKLDCDLARGSGGLACAAVTSGEPRLPRCAAAGTVVQLLLEPTTARQGFTLPNPKKLGSIKALYSEVDFTKTGSADIVIGREDGQLEVSHSDTP